MKKPRSEKQLANDRRLAELAKAKREAKNKEATVAAPAVDPPKEVGIDETPYIAPEQDVNELQKQVAEMKETMALLKAALLNNESTKPHDHRGDGSTLQMNKQGELIGEWEKYIVDPAHYPDPTARLKAEPRLQPMAFNYNYELEYDVATSSYETKSGKNVKEPKFMISLNRIVLDDQGEPTNKRYVARKLIFHEDPQAALVIARENGLDVDKSDEKAFLDEMRYLRVRDWLFGIFWPKPADEQAKIREEVIGGTVVQVFTKNSVESSEIDFSKLKSKLV